MKRKTKVTELSGNDQEIFAVEGLGLLVNQFKFLGVTIKSNNDWSVEIVDRIHKAEKAYYALLKFFESKLFSRRTKLRLYMGCSQTKADVRLRGMDDNSANGAKVTRLRK